MTTTEPSQGQRSMSRRTYPPPAFTFNPTCTVAVVSTIAGLRPYELHSTATPIAQSLIPSPKVLHELNTSSENRTENAGGEASRKTATPAAAAAAPCSKDSEQQRKTAASTPLWTTPVYTSTVAGESSVLAVVFRARPAVFAAPTYTVNASKASTSPETKEASILPPLQTSAEQRQTSPSDTEGDEPVDHEQENTAPSQVGNATDQEDASAAASARLSLPPAHSLEHGGELFAAEAEYRRYVYLFDAATGLCLAALHFCGSPIVALRANAAVLLVAAADLFHVVELTTLRYVRQQSMYKPLNPRAILDLSAAVPIKPREQLSSTITPSTGGTQKRAAPQFTYAVAFPQSARGYRGDVTVLTLRTSAPPSQQPKATKMTTSSPHDGNDNPPSTNTTGAMAEAPAMDYEGDEVPVMVQRTIAAHHHAVAHLRLRHDGRLLITASELGTTLKLFDTVTGTLLTELQRGHRPASVLSLGVQADAYRVAALSTNGTLHVFNCAAVVQAWEAGRRWSSTPTPAESAGVASSVSVNKTRADFKLKVTPLQRMLHQGYVGGGGVFGNNNNNNRGVLTGASSAAVVTLPADGSLQHSVGFGADGRTVWVAQVASTDTQLTFASVAGASASSHRRCVGILTRFAVVPLGYNGSHADETDSEHFSIDM